MTVLGTDMRLAGLLRERARLVQRRRDLAEDMQDTPLRVYLETTAALRASIAAIDARVADEVTNAGQIEDDRLTTPG